MICAPSLGVHHLEASGGPGKAAWRKDFPLEAAKGWVDSLTFASESQPDLSCFAQQPWQNLHLVPDGTLGSRLWVGCFGQSLVPKDGLVGARPASGGCAGVGVRIEGKAAAAARI